MKIGDTVPYTKKSKAVIKLLKSLDYIDINRIERDNWDVSDRPVRVSLQDSSGIRKVIAWVIELTFMNGDIMKYRSIEPIRKSKINRIKKQLGSKLQSIRLINIYNER